MAEDPWTIVILEADSDADGSFFLFELSVTVERGPEQLASSSDDDNTVQSVGFGDGGGNTQATIWYEGESTTVDNASMSAGEFATTLGALDVLREVVVTATGFGTGTSASPWQVSFAPRDGGSGSFETLVFAVSESVESPQETVADVVDSARRAQGLVSPTAPLTLWYGDYGVDVKYESADGPTAAELKAALESLEQVSRVEVGGTGTVADPWRIVLVAADQDADGAFHRIRAENYQQSALDVQQSDELVKRQSRDAAIATQSIFLASWQDHATVRYGDESVEVTGDMTADDVAFVLESLDSIRDVWVGGLGRVDLSREQSFDASLVAAFTQFDYLGRVVELGEADIDADPDVQAELIEARLRTIESLEQVRVRHDDGEYIVRFADLSAETLLISSGPGFQELEVLRFDSPWSVAILDAILDAARTGRKILVVTANIALQEQLVRKDLPLLAELLPVPFSFALMKGRSNYLCRWLLEHEIDRGTLEVVTDPDHADQLEPLVRWTEGTRTGDVSELSFQPARSLWSRRPPPGWWCRPP